MCCLALGRLFILQKVGGKIKSLFERLRPFLFACSMNNFLLQSHYDRIQKSFCKTGRRVWLKQQRRRAVPLLSKSGQAEIELPR